MKVLVLTDDRLGPEMAGSAVRAWELGRVLAAAGHDVLVRGDAGSRPPAATGPRVAERARLGAFDAVLAPAWCLPPRAFVGRRRLVVDGATPLLAELAAMPDTAEVRRRRRTAAARVPLAAARADALLVAGDRQRMWWSRRLRRPGLPLLEVPFGLPDGPPADSPSELPGVPPGWDVVLWWGGTWPWLDLDTLLAARARLGGARISVVVPTAVRPGGRRHLDRLELERRAARHGLAPPQVVALERWIPYAERHRALQRASVVAVLHRPGPESELSFRTRALDGLWAGVPVLLTEGGAVAERARAEGWGAVVPPADARAAAAAIELLLRERFRERYRRAMDAARVRWRWSQVASPLLAALPALPAVPRGRLAPALLRAALVLAGSRP